MKKIDFSLLAVVIFLTLFGLFIIYDASSYIAFRDFSDKYHYIKDQSVWIVLGFLALGFFYLFDYHRFYNLALPMLISAIALLILVFIPGLGISVMGARRWINFQVFVLQPAEFVKLALAIYLSAWFSQKEKGRLQAFLLLMGFVMLLIMLEPDMGTASIVLFEALVIFYLSGGNVLALAYLLPVVGVLGVILALIEPYRAKRLMSFFSGHTAIEQSSYHVKQILIALGMGGWIGVGFGNSLQKYAYLPENTTDSIFAILAEEVGFIGSTFFVLLFAFVTWRGFQIAMRAKDMFGRVLAGGLASFLGMQILINLSAQTALVPLTGVPLPFISYGGSALIVDLAAIGILLNISRQQKA